MNSAEQGGPGFIVEDNNDTCCGKNVGVLNIETCDWSIVWYGALQ